MLDLPLWYWTGASLTLVIAFAARRHKHKDKSQQDNFYGHLSCIILSFLWPITWLAAIFIGATEKSDKKKEDKKP